MKKLNLLFGVAMGILVGTLGSCKSDVNLAEIDTTVGAEMALALPIGEVSAHIGDFLGCGNVENFIKVREDGVLYYQDTFKIKRPFHLLNLSRFTTSGSGKIYASQAGVTGNTLQKGQTYTLRYPIKATLNDINKSFENERVDKIQVKEAVFTVSLGVPTFSLPFSDIKKVELVLGNQFSRPAGTTINVPVSGANYGSKMSVTVDNFLVNFVRNSNEALGNNNVVNTMPIDLVITMTPSNNISLSSTAHLAYGLSSVFQHYDAAWGWFKPSNKMSDEDTIRIADEWAEWADLQNLLVPFAEPHIEMNVTNSIGAPLIMDGKYVFVRSEETGVEKFATFDGSKSLMWHMPNYVKPSDPIDAEVKNTKEFSQKASEGHLDELFAIRPDFLGYAFDIYPDEARAKQEGVPHYRITEDTHLNVEAILTMPLTFNPDLSLEYGDTIKKINIEEYQLDSLLAEVKEIEEVEVRTVKLILEAINTIPFDIDAEYMLLDSANNEIDIPVTNFGKKVHIAGPTKVDDAGRIVEPGKTTLIIDVNEDKWNELVKMKKVWFKASLGKNTTYVQVLDASGLKIRIAVAADVKAVANLDTLF